MRKPELRIVDSGADKTRPEPIFVPGKLPPPRQSREKLIRTGIARSDVVKGRRSPAEFWGALIRDSQARRANGHGDDTDDD